MKGDFTRVTFRPERHYRGVRMQQGRVQLDADWNEQVDIEAHRSETAAGDLVGPCGGPHAGAGFGLRPQDEGIVIGAGRYYVDGILCENEQDVAITAQPDLPGFALPADPGLYLAYLDVWEREVSALDDPLIREVALGGPDTATRGKTVWQVKLLRVGDPVATAPSPEPSPAPSPQPPTSPPTAPPVPPTGIGGLLGAGLGPLRAGSIAGLVSRLATGAVPVAAPTGTEDGTASGPTLPAGIDGSVMRAILASGAGLAGRFHGQPGSSTVPDEPTAPPSGAAPHCGSDFPEWDALLATADGSLAARATPEASADDPCIIPAAAGYRRLENQLYRVEIHDGGPAGTATFKWSRDNGSVATRWTGQSGNDLTVSGIGRDQASAFAGGQWVELTDDGHELAGEPGTLVRLSKVDGTTLTVDPSTATGPIDRPSFPTNPKVRRWDSAGPQTVQISSTNGWLALEGGVEVRFEGDAFLAGNYWVIPARTVIGDVEWPANGDGQPVAQPARGIRHHLCRLALAQLDDAGWAVLSDCRSLFPAATELTELHYVGGDGQEATPDPTNTTTLIPLGQPLRVGVSAGSWPVAGATVRFLVVMGNGALQGAGGQSGPALDVVTADDGLAVASWSLDPATATQQVSALLLDPSGEVLHLPVLFTATLSSAAGGGIAPVLASEGTETIQPTQQVLIPGSPLAAGLYAADISIADPAAPGSTKRVSWQEEYVVSEIGIGPIDVLPGGIAPVVTAPGGAPPAGPILASPIDVVHVPTELAGGGPSPGGGGPAAGPGLLGRPLIGGGATRLGQPGIVHVPIAALAGPGAPSPVDVTHIVADPAGAGAAPSATPVDVVHVAAAPETGTAVSATPVEVAHVPLESLAGLGAGITPVDVTHVSPVAVAPGAVEPGPGIGFRPLTFVGRQWRVTNVGQEAATVSYRIFRIPQG